MPKKNTLDDFINKARTIHGNLYDYSRVEYVNNKTPVEIVCNKHGSFYQRPDSHLNGKGCAFCRLDKHRTLLFGVGINDLYLTKTCTLYRVWKGMLERCYSSDGKYSSYKDCSVCEEWHKLSNFRDFFDKNYIEGFALDKDFIIPNNKVYSPSTCIFIPKEINSILVKCGRDKNGKLHGVNFSKRLGKYVSNVSFLDKCKRIHIGVYDTIEDAESAYISKKLDIIKSVADKYKDALPVETYKLIINHKF